MNERLKAVAAELERIANEDTTAEKQQAAEKDARRKTRITQLEQQTLALESALAEAKENDAIEEATLKQLEDATEKLRTNVNDIVHDEDITPTDPGEEDPNTDPEPAEPTPVGRRQ
jgi:hypothetical protein